MFLPDETKVRAAAQAIRDAFESLVSRHLFGDAADVSPSMKIVAASVVVMAATHYARQMGLPKQMALSVVASLYDLGSVFEPSAPSGPNMDDA
jgi:hypothetical protein